MVLDLVLLGALLAFGALGARSGAIRQLSHWAGLACAYFLSGPLAAAAAPLAAPRLGLAPGLVKIGLSAVFFAALGALASLLVERVLGGRGGEREGTRPDRAGGFVLGAGKGAALAYVLLSAFVFFEKPLAPVFGPRPAPDSRALRLARERNLFALAPASARARLEQLEKLAEAAKDPRAAQTLAQDPALKSLLDDPALKSALGDPRLAEALKTGDVSKLKDDPRFAPLLDDPRLKSSEPLTSF